MKKSKMALMLVAAGCAATLSGFAAYAEEADLSGEIKVYGWTQMATALTQTAERFMELHPEAKITVEQVDGSYTKLLPELASGQGLADVFMVQNTDIQSFVLKYEGQILDISDLVKGEEENFVASALRTCYKADEDAYYAVPIDIGPCAMMYRTDIFEEYGINAEDLKTWDDYIEAGKVILEGSNGEIRMNGFDFNGASSQDMMKMYFAQQGGSYYDEEGNPTLASEEMIRAAEKVKEMIDAGILMDFPNEWNDRITALAAGQICTLPYPEWFSIVMKDSVADQAGLWAYAPMPSFDGNGGSVCLGGSVLAVNADTEYPELAKAFVAYSLMNNESADIMYGQGQFQAYKPFYEAECYQEIDPYFNVSLGNTFSEWTDAPEIDFGPYFADLGSALGQATGEIFVNGVDAETALNAATETVLRAVENY